MNILTTLRKPNLSIFLAFVVLIASCTQNNELIPNNHFDKITLKEIHQKVISDLETARSQFVGFKKSSSEIEQELITNLEYVNKNGIEALFESKNIDVKFLEMLEFYHKNSEADNVYELLAENYRINSTEEANFLFTLVSVSDIIITDYEPEGIPYDCVLAIAGTLAATAGAAFITGGAALVIFLVSKGIALASIIETCG